MKPSIVALAALLPLFACQRAPIYTPTKVEIPISVPCRVKIPQHPAWPTLALKPDAGLFDKAKAALAELEYRKGYEDDLIAAMEACNDDNLKDYP